MSATHPLFESFDDASFAQAGRSPGEPTADAGAEAQRLAAYENGYKSGWDDCLAAEVEETKRVGAELARNISDLGFTYHEARTQLLSEMETLLAAFFTTVLPDLTGTAVVTRVIDDLVELASESIDRPVEIVAPPSAAALVRDLMPSAPAMQVDIVAEPALAVGQAYLRFGTIERKYDLSDMTDRLVAAVATRQRGMKEGDTDAAAG